NEPQEQNDNENEHFEKREYAAPLVHPAAEHGRDGVNEGDLDVEHDVDERHDVKARVEVEPRLPDRSLTALVRFELLGVGVVGTNEFPEKERAHDERGSD